MHSIRPDQYYTDVIAKPIVRKSTNNRDIEVTAEDEQGFLLRQQQYLQVKFSFETLFFSTIDILYDSKYKSPVTARIKLGEYSELAMYHSQFMIFHLQQFPA